MRGMRKRIAGDLELAIWGGPLWIDHLELTTRQILPHGKYFRLGLSNQMRARSQDKDLKLKMRNGQAREEPRTKVCEANIVQMDQGRSLPNLIELSQELESVLQCKVDILTDEGLSPYLKSAFMPKPSLLIHSMSYLTHHKFPAPLDRDQATQDWRRRGFSCDLFTDPPGREWNDFVHATNELVTVMEGRLKLTVGEEEIIAEPGGEVVIPKGIRHSVKNISSSTTRWFYGYD
jgi:mannose-6-phosphate isomerase-like protein (cupin superfamily)